MAMDIVGPLTPSGPENHTNILVMGEYLTRYITVASMPDATAESIAKAFYKNIITRHGVPEMVLTDQGQNFLSKVMEYCTNNVASKPFERRPTALSATVWSSVQIERLPI
jgi:DNA-binding protein Fis